MGIVYGTTTLHQATRGVVQDGLILNLDPDAGEITSSSWKSFVGDVSMTLYNSPETTNTAQGVIANLDGTDDYMRATDTNDDFLLATAGTVEAWIYQTPLGQGRSMSILGKFRHSNTNAGGVWQFKISGNGSGGSTPTLVCNGVSPSNGTFTYNQWKHCVAAWSGGSGGTTTIYLDGSSVATGTTAFAEQQQVGQPIFNGVSTGGYPVKIGGYRVYNRALTAAEVSKNFNVMRHRFGI